MHRNAKDAPSGNAGAQVEKENTTPARSARGLMRGHRRSRRRGGRVFGKVGSTKVDEVVNKVANVGDIILKFRKEEPGAPVYPFGQEFKVVVKHLENGLEDKNEPFPRTPIKDDPVDKVDGKSAKEKANERGLYAYNDPDRPKDARVSALEVTYSQMMFKKPDDYVDDKGIFNRAFDKDHYVLVTLDLRRQCEEDFALALNDLFDSEGKPAEVLFWDYEITLTVESGVDGYGNSVWAPKVVKWEKTSEELKTWVAQQK